MGKVKKLAPGSSYIEGLILEELRLIPTNGGPVMHMLRSDSSTFKSFGEIYFSEVDAGSLKGWKKHKKQTQNFAVPHGLMKLVFYDDRANSPSQGRLAEVILGRPDNYCLLQVPPLLWYSFKSLNEQKALMANCVDIPHDPEESVSLDINSELIPYRW